MPWSRRRKRIVWAAAVAVGIAATLLLLSLPILQEPSGYTLVDLRLYSYEAESLFGSASWLNFSYHGVVFGFHLWCGPLTPGGATLCGNATEPGGAAHSYSFFDGPPSPSPQWQTWVAPDSHDAVEYLQGGTVHLLVAA